MSVCPPLALQDREARQDVLPLHVETTKIKFADDNNHERGMKVICDYKSRSKKSIKESGEIMKEGDIETRSDVHIIGSLHGILDTLKEKRLFSIWFASDDLRDLAVLMILKTRKN